MSNQEDSSEDSAGTDSYEYESCDDEDEYPEDKFKSYSFVYVDQDYPDAIHHPRRNKKLRPDKAAAAAARRDRRRTNRGRKTGDAKSEDDWTDDEDFDSDGSSEKEGAGYGPPTLRLVPTLRAFEAMNKLREWETAHRLGVFRAAGSAINSKTCAQAYRPSRLGSKFKTPGPWLTCATQHFTTNCYAKGPKVEEEETTAVVAKVSKPQPSKTIGRKYATPPVRTGYQTCTHCCYWNFEHHADTEMYYQDYLDRVTFIRHKTGGYSNEVTGERSDEEIPGNMAASRDQSEEPRPSCSCAPKNSEPPSSVMSLGRPSGEAKGKYAEIKSRYLLPKTPPTLKVDSDEVTPLVPVRPGTSSTSKVSSLPALPQFKPKCSPGSAIKPTGLPKKPDVDRLSLPKLNPRGSRLGNACSNIPRPAAVPGEVVTKPGIASLPSLSKGGPQELKPRRWISPTIKTKPKIPKTKTKMIDGGSGKKKKKKKTLIPGVKKGKKVKKSSRKTKTSQ